LIKPALIGGDKNLLGSYGIDLTERFQEVPQISSRLSFWIGAQPSHPFPLDMIETSLDLRFWPYLPDHPHHRALSIHSDIKRIQPRLAKSLEPVIGAFQSFFFGVNIGESPLTLGVHEADVTALLVKISPVIEHILRSPKIDLLSGDPFKPVSYDACDFGPAIA
jgi:hypothetical protein